MMALDKAITIIINGVILPELAPLISILPGIITIGKMIKIANATAGAIMRGSNSSD